MKKYLILFILLLCSFLQAQSHDYTIPTENMIYRFSFYTEYNQFYLEDKESKGATFNNFWSEEAFESQLAMDEGVIAVGTYCYGNVKGQITVLDEPIANIDYDLYDHVVEGGIYIPSGVLNIVDCPSSTIELSIKLKPGKYRVRAYGSNFASVKEHDLANDTDDDYYRIEIWPSDDLERKVLKQFKVF